MSAPTPRFVGKVERGKLYVADREQFDRYLTSLQGMVEVVVKKWRKNRSLDQNAWYWGVILRLIADHTGYDSNELHEIYKIRFLESREVDFEGTRYHIIKTTTKLSTVEFGEYLEKVIQHAAELEIVIPPPQKVA